MKKLLSTLIALVIILLFAITTPKKSDYDYSERDFYAIDVKNYVVFSTCTARPKGSSSVRSIKDIGVLGMIFRVKTSTSY